MNCNKKSHFDSVTPVHRHGREGGALGGGAGLGGEGVGEGWGGVGRAGGSLFAGRRGSHCR